MSWLHYRERDKISHCHLWQFCPSNQSCCLNNKTQILYKARSNLNIFGNFVSLAQNCHSQLVNHTTMPFWQLQVPTTHGSDTCSLPCVTNGGIFWWMQRHAPMVLILPTKMTWKWRYHPTPLYSHHPTTTQWPSNTTTHDRVNIPHNHSSCLDVVTKLRTHATTDYILSVRSIQKLWEASP